MKRFFWIEGRLSWPVVVAAALISITVLLADMAWRFLVVPAEALFLESAVGLIAVAIIVTGLYFLTRRSARSD